jgi:hypothetical protein
MGCCHLEGYYLASFLFTQYDIIVVASYNIDRVGELKLTGGQLSRFDQVLSVGIWTVVVQTACFVSSGAHQVVDSCASGQQIYQVYMTTNIVVVLLCMVTCLSRGGHCEVLLDLHDMLSVQCNYAVVLDWFGC